MEASEYTGPSEFINTHSHSVFSTLDGVCTPEQYAEQCHLRKWPAMAITEHGHMGSVPDMYSAFEKYGLKFVPGCEIYYNDWEPIRQNLPGKLSELKANDFPTYTRIVRNRHLTVLAKNQTGYSNLIKLTTQAYETGLFGAGKTKYPRIWFDKLCEYKEGLIILSGCINGPVAHEIRLRELKNKADELMLERSEKEAVQDAYHYLKKFKQVFGDDYYVECQMPGVANDDQVFKWQVALADKLKIKLALTTDSHYLDRADYELQKCMMAIAQNTTIDSPDLFHTNSDEQFMKTRGELWATFKNGPYCTFATDGDFENMCDNTIEIADKCEHIRMDTAPKIPELKDADADLLRAVVEGLKKKSLYNSTEKFMIDGQEVTYKSQAKLEVERFIDKGFASYFLITKDLINYGKSKGWPFGPRGSCGGSLVCFLLGITSINSCKWGLSFDRFLSPSRGGYLLSVKMDE